MYKINLLQSFVILLVLVALFQYGSGSQRICGPELAEVLDEVCWNAYNLQIKNPLQWQDYECNEGVADERLPYPYTISPFVVNVQSEEFKLMTKYGGYGYGVYDECCLKACTRNEMLPYCLQTGTFY